MSNYPQGKEPPCPLKHPGCAGIMKRRDSKSCYPCSQYARRPAPRQQEQIREPLASYDEAWTQLAACIGMAKDRYAGPAARTEDGRGAENEGGATYQVAIISTDKHPGTKFVKISASRLIVRWSHDGSALDYIANTAGNGQIWRQMLAGNTTPTLLVDLPKAFLHNFAWSADGEDLVLSRGQQANDAILLTNFQP